ncbi:hypothetical protein ACOMHN_019556 [Nucella lapillus]
MAYRTRPVCPVPRLLLVLLLSFAAAALFLAEPCGAQSGDGSDDEDQQEMRTSYACENGMLRLECPKRYVIRIKRANYGRFSLTLCNPLGITSNMDLRCISVTSRRIVATECDGHNKCEFQVTNQLFGDPCPGTSKYAEVKHYCEPEDVIHVWDSPTLRPLPDLPEAPFKLRRPSVPMPEKIQVCMHSYPSASAGAVYDIYWQMPETSQTILHFMLKYSVGEEAHEKEMPGLKANDRYTFSFTPDEGKKSEAHLFAIKAFSLDYGWGDYSPLSTPERCQDDGSGTFVTHGSLIPVGTTSTTTTAQPKEQEGPRPMCLAVDKMGVRWPETWPNEVRTDLCPRYLGQGLMYYKCMANGDWDPTGPQTDKCTDVVLSTDKHPTTTTPPTTTTTTTSSTTTTTTTPQTTTATTPPSREVPMHSNPLITDMLRKLNRLSIKHAASLDLPSLLPRLTRDMRNYLDSLPDPQLKKSVANYFKDSMLTLSDELLKCGSAWSNMSVSQQRRTAASLMTAVEVTGLMAAATMDVGAVNITRKSNVVLKVMNVDLLHGRAAQLDGRFLTGPTMSKVTQFSIPPAVLHQAMDYDDVSVPVVFVVMSNMSEWLAPEPNSGSLSSNVIDARPRREPVRRLVNSDIVSASVSSRPLKNLAEPVAFLMEHRQLESVANPKCSFWDTEVSAWSGEGCWVFESNKTHTKCKCDHLTSFAVLMDITGATILIPPKARFSLELITYIGCTVSILCLMLSWVTFACFKSLDCDRNTIHKHLVFCLMVAQIGLVIGIQQTKPAILCSIIAGLLHFFFLASFAWMCLEGVQLYVMLVEVFESERSRVLWYYLFGYGVPAIIVATSAGIFPRGYGTEFHCWLTVERGFIWSFVGPAMAVMLINVIMLGIAIFIMVRHSSMSHTMRQKTAPQKMRAGYQCLAAARYSMGGSCSLGGGGYGVVGGAGGSHLYASIDHLELLTCHTPSRDEKLTWVKGAVVLVVLLGLTWVFGILYLDNLYHTLVFSYIFTVLNTLQGLFIFFFHCLLNDKVQKEYRRLVRHSHWLPECVRVRYGGASSTGSREPSSSGNVMSRFLHGKKRHSADGDSSSNSTKPFLNKDGNTNVPVSCPDGNTNVPVSCPDGNTNIPLSCPDPRQFSSSLPSSSEGATSSRLSTEFSHNNNRKTSRSSTFRSNGTDSRSLRHSEVNGVIGDLSEVPDCSVVDSEFVSEYCQQNLRVSTEVKRYSTASEDSGRGLEDEQEQGHGDGLAALSVESLSNHPAYTVSSSDYGDGDKSDGWADSDNVDGEEMDEHIRYINLLTGPQPPQEEDDDDDDECLVDGHDVRAAVRRLPESLPLMLKQSDSETVLINNAINKPRLVCGGGGGGGAVRGSPARSPPSQTVPCLKPQSDRCRPAMPHLQEGHAGNSGLPNLSQYLVAGGMPPSLQKCGVGLSSVPRHPTEGPTSVGPLSVNRYPSEGPISGGPLSSVPRHPIEGPISVGPLSVNRYPTEGPTSVGPLSVNRYPSEGPISGGPLSSVPRHPSEGPVYFSPFRFPGSDC